MLKPIPHCHRQAKHKSLYTDQFKTGPCLSSSFQRTACSWCSSYDAGTNPCIHWLAQTHKALVVYVNSDNKAKGEQHSWQCIREVSIRHQNQIVSYLCLRHSTINMENIKLEGNPNFVEQMTRSCLQPPLEGMQDHTKFSWQV